MSGKTFHRIATVEFSECNGGPIPRNVKVSDITYSFTLNGGQSFTLRADWLAVVCARRELNKQLPEFKDVNLYAYLIQHSENKSKGKQS